MLEALPRRALLAGLPVAIAAGSVPAVAAAATVKDPLVILGEQFEAAWRDQVATFERLSEDMSDAAGDACDAAYAKTCEIVDLINAAKAVTLAGLVVKARACSWCHQGGLFTDDAAFKQYGNAATTDRRLAATIIRDLISLSGAPLPEIPVEG